MQLPRQIANLPSKAVAIVQSTVAEVPTVFLLDEHHTLKLVIDDNIATAHWLVANANAILIGVENLAAAVDEYPGPAPTLPSPPIGPGAFERAMRAAGHSLVGIDSPRWQERILDDVSICADVSHHFGQIERSKHFVRAMFASYRQLQQQGNLIISCGSAHNGHIMSISASTIGQPVGWPAANFVRLRSGNHP